jgi:hypothetical protein
MSKKPTSVLILPLLFSLLLYVRFDPSDAKTPSTCPLHGINTGFGEELGYAHNLSLAADFLKSTQFNKTVGLCREAPNVANNTYCLLA